MADSQNINRWLAGGNKVLPSGALVVGTDLGVIYVATHGRGIWRIDATGL